MVWYEDHYHHSQYAKPKRWGNQAVSKQCSAWAQVLPMGRHVWQFARPGILDHQHNSCARTEKFWVWNPAAFHSLVSSPERFWLVSTRRLAVERPQGALANDNASLGMKGWVIRGWLARAMGVSPTPNSNVNQQVVASFQTRPLSMRRSSKILVRLWTLANRAQCCVRQAGRCKEMPWTWCATTLLRTVQDMGLMACPLPTPLHPRALERLALLDSQTFEVRLMTVRTRPPWRPARWMPPWVSQATERQASSVALMVSSRARSLSSRRRSAPLLPLERELPARVLTRPLGQSVGPTVLQDILEAHRREMRMANESPFFCTRIIILWIILNNLWMIWIYIYIHTWIPWTIVWCTLHITAQYSLYSIYTRVCMHVLIWSSTGSQAGLRWLANSWGSYEKTVFFSNYYDAELETRDPSATGLPLHCGCERCTGEFRGSMGRHGFNFCSGK